MIRTIAVNLPEEAYQDASRLAKELGLSFNALLIRALIHYMKEEALRRFVEIVKTTPKDEFEKKYLK